MKILKIVLGLGTLLLAFVPLASAQGTTGKDARISLNFTNRKLADVAQYLREKSNSNIVVLGDAADAEISLDLTDVPWRDALQLAAEDAKCVIEERAGGILVVHKPARVNYEATDAEIRFVIDLIAKFGRANIVVAPEVKGSISVRLTDVPWRDALDVVVKTLGYVVVEENRGILRVVDPSTLQSQMLTKSYQLRYMRPKSIYKPLIKSEFLQPLNLQASSQSSKDISQSFTVLKALQKALSAGGDMDYIEAANVIIVRDTAQIHEQVRDILVRLDIEPAQVFCDVKFVSTLNSDLLDLGVDYGDGGPRIDLSGGAIPITLPFGLGGAGWEDFIIANPGKTGPFADPTLNAGNTIIPDTVFGRLSFTNFAATLKMLQRDIQANVVQAPRLIALDGHEATIFVGETIRYAEAKSEQGQAGGLQLSLSEASGSPVDVGFQLLIVPHVIPGTNNLTLDVIPKETSLSGASGASALSPAGFDVFTVGASGLEGTIALPRTRSATIVTTMLLESGQTAVIGGLTTEQDQKSESRVPYISRIPLLGELFKYRKKDRQRRSLLVFVTPTIVHSSAEQDQLLQHEFERRKTTLKAQVEALVGPQAEAPAAPAGN